MRTFEEIKNTIETGLGMHVCDLKIENVKLVNVFSGEVYPTNIYIKNKRIVSIDPSADLEAKKVLDGNGQYALPGLIDAHMHFESTMLSPEALASVVVPQGTTTMCADLMEIANVAGEEGLRAMLQSMNRLPYRMLIEVSSRVPTAPGLETTGAVLGAEEVANIMEWEESVSLGELDPSKILFVKDEYIKKVADTLAKRKLVNGHAIGRLGQELNVYASSGISDDHECVNTNEMIERLKVGMKVFIREGSSERNVDELIQGVIEHELDTSNLMFCTDDKHAREIQVEGHINYNVSRAVELGLDPMKAIQIATVNSAKHFRMEDEIGSITPGRLADIILVEDWREVKPTVVIFEGNVVAENGNLLEECKVEEYPDWLKHTVTLKNPITAESFAALSKKQDGSTKIHLIDMIPRQIINHHMLEEMQVKNGKIQVNIEKDILKLAVVERYGKNGNVGVGFVRGFELKKGALAYSMSHDHHNIVVVGTNDEDMALAVNEVARLNGGLSVTCGGKILNSMELPIGGLMSEKPAEEVMAQLDILNADAKALGCGMDAPFMSLSFISLPTVPDLGLTDLGLVDVLEHKLIPLEAEE
ncbi:adenine deaminase [Mediterraneibacter glycyrrhizinilyticus]|uniref:adenine deaminase n=1 Tax=Mediterraneibacter glycyrrhizinilyticus TaxID=342942 RepID=UPI001D093458|nr:adenine deaminase [Mediterraneibacter glycyrrhizinilyticus]MCB6308880.1 adenine deaminase [Lachnospiraceae bacterium 210521-DFI.1.109]MCB6426004.1 adenine deaminase [Mediterraneibacter glycyrrhizinilyticus]